jgi:hypothetical protein
MYFHSFKYTAFTVYAGNKFESDMRSDRPTHTFFFRSFYLKVDEVFVL